MAYTSSDLIAMFTERKDLEEKEVNGVRYVEFRLTKKQAKWLANVRAKELGYPHVGKHDYIGCHDWAMNYSVYGAGQVRMTIDGNDVKLILSPTAYLVRTPRYRTISHRRG